MLHWHESPKLTERGRLGNPGTVLQPLGAGHLEWTATLWHPGGTQAEPGAPKHESVEPSPSPAHLDSPLPSLGLSVPICKVSCLGGLNGSQFRLAVPAPKDHGRGKDISFHALARSKVPFPLFCTLVSHIKISRRKCPSLEKNSKSLEEMTFCS